jgi:hypothetical protein
MQNRLARTPARTGVRRAPRRLLLALLVLVLLFATACAASNTGVSPEKDGASDPGGIQDKTTEFSSVQDPDVSRKVIATASARLESADVEDSAARLTAAVEALGGYIAGSSLTEVSTGRFRAELVVKVPAGQLASLVARLSEFGTVRSTSSQTQDITDEYYDAAARLANAEAQEAQLLEVLKTAATVQDTLLVRTELDKVQERIEQLEGRIRMWDALVDMATLTVALEPTAVLVGEDRGIRILSFSELWKGVSRAFSGSIAFLLNAGGYLLIALSALLVPALVVLVAILLVVRLVRASRRRRTRRAAPPPPPSAPAGVAS